MTKSSFEWDTRKHAEKLKKHGVPFALAQYAFADPKRIIAEDRKHRGKEPRHLCFGQVGEGVPTVRFTYRVRCDPHFGAGDWRKGKEIYDHENQIHE
jgi:uncharacterized DUF497 family protein